MKIEKKHINISNPVDCSGCTACATICTHDAILMQPDALGFLYPKVDESKCVECGLCTKVCAFHPQYDISNNFEKSIVYGARHKQMDEVMKSRSGAVFVTISDYILDLGGVIYGVGYKDHFRVAHKRATTKEERDEFRGSKYVQSDLTGVFQSVKKDLQDGLYVLFSGTPCQTAGLKSYIGAKHREKLLLVDIICHGVPGPYLWRDYITYLENKHNSQVIDVNFRDKGKFGWRAHRETITYSSNLCESSEDYSMLFYSDLGVRLSCTICPFANTRRPSDITLGDFWGVEGVNPTFCSDNKGISLILCNTKTGLQVFEIAKEKLEVFEVFTEEYKQNRILRPINKPNKRERFISYYEKYGLEKAMQKFRLIGWRRNIDAFFEKNKSKISIWVSKQKRRINKIRVRINHKNT